jgi:hypothetical protein
MKNHIQDYPKACWPYGTPFCSDPGQKTFPIYQTADFAPTCANKQKSEPIKPHSFS